MGDYFFPLFYQKITTSCVGWKDDEFGCYMRLLIHQYDNGSIPGSLDQLARIAPSVKKNWPLVSKKFTKQQDGTLINRVMDGIRKKRLKKSEVLSENGSKGGRPKKQMVLNPESNLKAKGFENQKQIESNNNMVNVYTDLLEKGVKGEKDFEPLGSEIVKTVANEAWKDRAWRESICMGADLSEHDLKKWMAQYNASIASDFIEGFDAHRYRKIFGGWLNSQKSKGYDLHEKVTGKTVSAPTLKIL